MSLALSTLIYEWRRYLAAVVALAFSGLLVLVSIGIFTGIIHTVLATTERSRADLFILPFNAPQMVNNNTGLPERVKPLIYLDPDVVDVESFEGGGANLVNVPKSGQRQVQNWVQIWAVDTEPGALTLPVDYPDSVRQALEEPGAIAIDVTDVKRLGLQLGAAASLGGKTVRLRALLHNYQDVDRPTIVMSRQSFRMLGLYQNNGLGGPLMVKIRDPARADIVRDQLNAVSHHAYIALTRADLNRNDERAVLAEQIVALLLIVFVVLAICVGIAVTSVTLRGAISSNLREFASLRAVGISMWSLRLIVMELSFWVGVAGLITAALFTWAASLGTAAIGLPLAIRPGAVIFVTTMLMILAVGSGALALGVLKNSQPADLLR